MFEFVPSWIASYGAPLLGGAVLLAVVAFFLSPLGRRFSRFARQLVPGMSATEAAPEPADHRPTRPSIAVLPFKNNSGEPAQDFLADGFTEDVITTLSFASSFDVIARNSTFAFKGQNKDVREVGQSLGAAYVVEGSLRTVGENVRVTVQVNDTTTGRQIWAEKFDQPMTSFFDLQDDVVNTITCQIGPEIERAEIAHSHHLATEDLNAWTLVRRASVILNSERYTGSNLNRVVDLAHKAIERDAGYAEAHGVLSRAHALAVLFGESSNKEADIRTAETSFRRMRDLAPNDADTFFTQGQLALAKDEIETALTALKGAYKRNPNNVMVLSILGLTATRLGYGQDGIDLIERALRLSPQDPARHMLHFALANAALSVGDRDTALYHAKQSVDLFDEFPASLAIYAGALHEFGRDEEARAQIDRIRAVSPGTTRADIISGARWTAGLSDEQAESFDAFLLDAGVR